MTRPDKRQAILHAAGQLFLEQGFSGVSMDAIAKSAPVSKPTLYAHFQDKASLFAAVIKERCQGMLANIQQSGLDHAEPEAALHRMGGDFLDLIHDADAIRMHQILLSEPAQQSGLGKLFYDSGPCIAIDWLVAYLDRLAERHQLSIPQPDLTAKCFFSMLKGDSHMRCLLGLQQGISAEEKQVILQTVIPLFLRGIGYLPVQNAEKAGK